MALDDNISQILVFESDNGARFSLRLTLGNTAPSDGRTDTSEVLAVWRELELLAAANAAPPIVVSRGADAIYQIALDVSDPIDMLARVVGNDSSDLASRWDQREALGMHPLGSWIRIDITRASEQAAKPPMQLIGRFLQQLFLTMNLALPGSLNLYTSRYDAAEDAYAPPSLSSDILEGAFTQAVERGWPALGRLPVLDVWRWLQDAMSYDLDIATEPVDKALFAVLHVCEPRDVDVDNVLHVAQALEALFASGRDNIGAILEQRLEAVLGKPASHKRWFSKFYDIRSRIAHGSIPVLRPGSYCDWGENSAVDKYVAEFWEPVDGALAALLAVLQDMIMHRSRGYEFSQHAVRAPT